MAIDFTIEQRVARTRAEVFDFVTNPADLPKWDRRVVKTEILPPATGVGVGSRIREVRTLGPRRVEQTVQVSAYERPSHFGLQIVEGAFPVDADLAFEPLDDGTTLLRLHAHGRAPRRLKWLEPLLAAAARREMRRQYRTLARVLEGS